MKIMSLLILSFVFCGVQCYGAHLPLGPRSKPDEKKPTHYQYNPQSKANIERKRKYMNLIAPLDAAILSLRHELKTNFKVIKWTIEIPSWFCQPRTVSHSIRRLQHMKRQLIRTYKLYRVFEPIPQDVKTPDSMAN